MPIATRIALLAAALSEDSGSTSTESDAETDEPTFGPELDDHGARECDALAQDCPEGEKCVPHSTFGGSWDAHKCVPILGDQAPGEPCTYNGIAEATDNCDGTSICWDVMDVEGQPIGTCFQLCSGSPNDPACPPGYMCANLHSLELAFCFPQCDPIAQDCDINRGDVQCEALPGTSCVPFFDEGAAPPTFEQVGVCVSP
jgi:hypothetical protein